MHKFKKILNICSAVLVSFSVLQTASLASDELESSTSPKHLTIAPLDPRVPIISQLDEEVSPVVLINVFKVDPTDRAQLLRAWENDANWMKRQPGYISTQLHEGIAGSSVFLNYAIWESVAHFKAAFTHPEFRSTLSAYPASAVAQPHLFSKVAVPNLCTN